VKNGKFVYSKPGSDEVIGEVVYANGFTMLARVALSSNGVKYPDSATVACLAGLIAGEEAGIEGVEIGNLHKVDEMKVARAMCNIDIDLVTEDDDEDEEVSEADANPTDTSGENC
jgi:hypothetical protein